MAKTTRSREIFLSLIQRPRYSSLLPWVSARWGTGYLKFQTYNYLHIYRHYKHAQKLKKLKGKQNPERNLKKKKKKKSFYYVIIPRKELQGLKFKGVYISAESKKLIPAPKASSRRRNDCGRVFCSPKVMVPETQRGESKAVGLKD